MRHRRARQKVRANSTLGDHDLPHYNDPSWVKRRKIRVVAAVRGGIIPLIVALERFNITHEEYLEWESEVGNNVARRKRLCQVIMGWPRQVAGKREYQRAATMARHRHS